MILRESTRRALIVDEERRRIWETFRPNTSARPHEWATGNIFQTQGTQFPGAFDPLRAPWINTPLERMADNATKDVTLLAAAQVSKTYAVSLFLAWASENDPGETLWTSNSESEVKGAAKDKIRPMLESSKAVKAQLDRHRQKTAEFQLDLMSIKFASAKAYDKLFSKTIRYLLLDEVHAYRAGVLQTILKRTRAVWNRRRILMSRPHDWLDDVHRFYLAGDQNRFLVPCFQCNGPFEMKPATVTWDENDDTNPGGATWNWKALFETIRLTCPLCGHKIHATETERRAMTGAGFYKAENPNAPIESASFTWSALVGYWVELREIVREFIEARDASRAYYFEPLKVYIRETCGEPWQDRSQGEDSVAYKGPYKLGDPWPEAKDIFLAADIQAKHQEVVVRAFNEEGDSRLLLECICKGYDETTDHAENTIRNIQLRFGIPDGSVLIDGGGGGPRYDEAIAAAVRYGWTVLIGDSRRTFRHDVRKNGRVIGYVQKPWSKYTPRDSMIGSGAEGQSNYGVYYWSNPTIEDALQGLLSQRTKVAGRVVAWWLPRDISEDYMFQLHSRHKVLVHSKKLGRDVWQWRNIAANRPDHKRDCELMILVAAMMIGLLLKPAEVLEQRKGNNQDGDEESPAT